MAEPAHHRDAPRAPPSTLDAISHSSSSNVSPSRVRRRRHASMPEKQLASMSAVALAMKASTSVSLDTYRLLRTLERRASSSESGSTEVSLDQLAQLLSWVEELSASVAQPAAAAAAQRLRLATMMANEPQLASHLEAQFSSPSVPSSRVSTPSHRQGATPTPLPDAPISEAISVRAVHTAQRAEREAMEVASAAESAAVPVGAQSGSSADMDSITGTTVSAPAATRSKAGDASPATSTDMQPSVLTAAPVPKASTTSTTSSSSSGAAAGRGPPRATAARASFTDVSDSALGHARCVLAARPAAQQVLDAVPSARAIVAQDDAAAAGSLVIATPASMAASAANSSLSVGLSRTASRLLLNGGMGAQGSASAVVALLLELGSWEFDIFALAALRPHTVIQTVAWACLLRHDLPRSLSLPEANVRRWLEAVEEGYTDPPYHNRVHGADVTQTTFWFTWSGKAVTAITDEASGVSSVITPVEQGAAGGGMATWLSPEECLALVLGAAAHDTGHFGRNNPFLVATEHPLALRYNDRSPLESMHAARAFELMRDPDMDWLSAMPVSQRKGIRRDMLSIILATDNAEHFAQLGRLQATVEAARTAHAMTLPSPSPSGDASDDATGVDAGIISTAAVLNLETDDAARTLIKGLALHAADVSNPAKVFSTAAVWADRVRREFYEQGDEEREKGLKIAPGFDRHSEIPMGKFQLGFIRAIVQPLYRALEGVNCSDLVADGVTPWFTLQQPLDHLDRNIARWEGRLAAEAAAATAAATAGAVKSVQPPPPPAPRA